MIKKDISYATRSKQQNLLDIIYDPGMHGRPVIFFIHGGSWMSGSKNMYTKLGEHLSEKGFVTVLISYRLFPQTDAFGMSDDCRDALSWCKQNISQFGGDPNKIILMGHSAGGHLAAVTGLSADRPRDHIAGFILIDAFGLSAFHFLTEYGIMVPEFFAEIFGKQKDKWPLVSPDKLMKEDLPPFLILTGGGTSPFLAFDNENFVNLLKKYKVDITHKILPAFSHMQMIYQFEEKNATVYDDIINWINSVATPGKK
jgi:acetyl esterase/lipase